MKRLAIIVEGRGDVSAVSALVAKTALTFGQTIYACEPPIRGGEARKLSREGELERMIKLANSREEADEILILVDLDDDCAAEFHDAFQARADALRGTIGKPVQVCFCVREYETWFLEDLDTLRHALPEYGWSEDVIDEPETIRGAKERLREIAKARGYKPARDQLAFTKKLNPKKLAAVSRSFRKFVKCITGNSYDEIAKACGGV